MTQIPHFLWEKMAFRAISEYAVHSHIYYELNDSIISDAEYDQLCKWLLENFDSLKPHDKNNYLDRQLLNAGSGFGLTVTGYTRDDARSRLGLPPYVKLKSLSQKDDKQAELNKLLGLA